MKIHVNKDGAGWIVDDIRNDYKKHTRHEFVSKPSEADICWCLSMWNFEEMYRSAKGRPIVATIHHVDMKKVQYYTPIFNMINQRASAVIVPNVHTLGAIHDKIKVPIHRIPYWLLSKRMPKSYTSDILLLRDRLLGGDAELLIGSFQKDSETGTASPKLSKGPDVFCDVVERIHREFKPVRVILTGYARKYVISRLEAASVPYVVFARTNDINELYDCLDWYLVTSRYEGGPQALLEASYRSVNLLSTDVGMASGCLHPASLCGSVDDFVHKIKNDVSQHVRNREIVSNNFTVNQMIPRYDDLFENILD